MIKLNTNYLIRRGVVLYVKTDIGLLGDWCSSAPVYSNKYSLFFNGSAIWNLMQQLRWGTVLLVVVALTDHRNYKVTFCWLKQSAFSNCLVQFLFSRYFQFPSSRMFFCIVFQPSIAQTTLVTISSSDQGNSRGSVRYLNELINSIAITLALLLQHPE